VYQTIDALGLRSHVRHVEAASDVELAHLYLSAGLLALPSHYEGFGLPALEAMHCRCPVLASNRASLPEVVGPAGILLDPDDVEAWTANLRRILLDEELRRQMVTAGLEQARNFSWRQTALATREVYERLA
jgi:glycosyltransferase involved in cell wall biosynthesis